MKSLVTGGNGFIGGHLIEKLLDQGHTVVALDCAPLAPTYLFKHQAQIQVATVNLVTEKNLEKHFRGVDWVFHLAGASDIIPSIERPISYHEANVTATVYVLEACRKARVKRFIYSASSTCYGIPTAFPTPETAPMKPMYPYALTKYLGELYALHYAGVFRLPVVSLRLFNVYGPRTRISKDYGPVLSIFMAQKIAGKPYTIVGDGTQTRDFTYVSDVVDAFIMAAKSKLSGEVFNVGSGGTYSINNLVKLLGGTAVYIPKRPGEPDCTFADIRKIKKLLGWKPRVSFDAGIARVLAHIDDWKSAPVWTPTKIAHATKPWFSYLKDSTIL